MEEIRQEAQTLQGELVQWRRHFHANPELGLDTPGTARYIIERLKEMGISDITEGVGGHGVTALIKGEEEGPVLAIRADMDALPIEEETGLPFSASNGLMHACGHDAHAAMLLGAAKLIAEKRHVLRGTVKLIFQPAEEPVIGAKAMIDDGCLENPHVDAIIGLHTGMLWKEVDCGQVGIRSGGIMASLDRFKITFQGQGGHGATPHITVDPISMAGQAICGLQTIASREVDPVSPLVLTIGKIEGGTAYNIIPGACTIEGTVRCVDVNTRTLVRKRMEELSNSVATSMRGRAEVEYYPGPPPLINDPDVVSVFRASAEELLGGNMVKEIGRPSMGSEDFAYYLEKVPGAFLIHGSCNTEKGQTFPHHNSRFDIDEDVLWVGTACLANMAIKWLGCRSQS